MLSVGALHRPQKKQTSKQATAIFFTCCLSVHVDNYTIIVQKNALVFVKSTRYYNLYFFSLYS
jgi:hypothetical protein